MQYRVRVEQQAAMTRSSFINLSAIATALLCCGCNTRPTDCDPSKASFYNNTACLASGGYDARQARLELELAREQRLNRDFHAVLAALDQEQTRVKRQLRESESGYRNLDHAWNSLQADLKRGYGENQSLARQIEAIDRDLERRKTPSPHANDRHKERQRSDLRRKLSLLHQEIDAGIYD